MFDPQVITDRLEESGGKFGGTIGMDRSWNAMVTKYEPEQMSNGIDGPLVTVGWYQVSIFVARSTTTRTHSYETMFPHSV